MTTRPNSLRPRQVGPSRADRSKQPGLRDANQNNALGPKDLVRRRRRLDAIRDGFVRGKVDLKRLPSEMKSRVVGNVTNAVQIDSGPLRATLWRDAEGQNVIIRQVGNQPIDIATLGEHIDSLALDSSPDRLTIELTDAQSSQAIRDQLLYVDEALSANISFIGAGLASNTFSSWRKDLEDNSQNRVSNSAYIDILRLLDRAIQLENTRPQTHILAQQQLDTLAQITQRLPAAASSSRQQKSGRNDAIAQLQKNINAHLPVLQRQRIQLLRQLEDSIKDLGVAKRTPSEVMVHFLHSLRAAQLKNPNAATLTTLEQQARQTILKHEMTLEKTQQLLRDAGKSLARDNFPQLAQLTKTLTAHLPKDQAALAPTRLHDNVYGRVLDSGIVVNLVKNPPKEVVDSMKQAAKAMATIFRSTPPSQQAKEQTAEGMQDYLTTKDPRFWGPLVPSLDALSQAKTPQARIDALIAFLDNPGDDGHAAIAIPYVLVKTAIVLQQRTPLPWMQKAEKNYDKVIMKQTGRVDAPLTDFGRFTALTAPAPGAGLNLRAQFNPFVESGTVPTVRPTLKNMPKFEQDINLLPAQPPSDAVSTDPRFPTASVETALLRGLPFGSGVSGSTNIMLHLFEHMKSQPGNENIDPKPFLLGTMMFLVYDGGHSIQEVLWTANQLDKQLNLNLNLGDPDRPNQFVADYEKFLATFTGETQAGLQEAMDNALNTTLGYFADRSIYSDTRVSSQAAATPTVNASTVATPSPLGQQALPASTPSLTTQISTSAVVSPPLPIAAPPPPPAAPVIGDLSHPNPALYFMANNANGENLRVDSANPGYGWTRVEQFCSVLATHWLTKTNGGNQTFASLSAVDQQAAIQSLVEQSGTGGGLATQVAQAQAQLQGTSEKTETVLARLANQGYPPGTKIWFGNDRHVQAAIVLPSGQYKVYDPDQSTTLPLLQQQAFSKYARDGGNNAFVIKLGGNGG